MPFIETWLRVLLETTVRGSILIAAAAVIAWFLRRHGAELRSALWHGIGCIVILMPALSMLMPEWRLAVPRVVAESRASIAATLDTRRWDERAPEASRATPPAGQRVDGAEPDDVLGAKGDRPNARGATTVPVTLIVFALWSLGAIVVVIPILLSLISIAQLERRARLLSVESVASRIGDHPSLAAGVRLVRVLEGPAHIAPMTWGILRPRVLLPAGWERWPSSVTAAVLAHELAHVRRRDVLRQLPWDLARVLFWFNPIVSGGARASHLAREQACDEDVVRRGLAPTTYADALLALVRVLRGVARVGAPALTGGGERELAKRIAALLAPHCARTPPRATVAAATLIVAIVTVSLASASVAPSGDQPVIVGGVGRALDSAFADLAKRGLSGTVLVAEGDRVVFAKGFGFADRERGVLATVSTRYHVAGVTKAFTAAAIADLIDRGAIEPHAAVSRYIPELRAPAGSVTIHQLLTHTDGLGDTTSAVHTREAPEFVASLGRDTPAFDAGASYVSTDVGHSLLALVVERTTGRSFQQHIRERFLAPAGMARSFLRFDPTAPSEQVAIGYSGGGAGVRVIPNADAWGVRGSRGLVTTADDLRRWYVALVEGQLVTQGALNRMFTPYFRTEKPFEQGYGWLLYDSTSGPPFGGAPVPVRRRSGREPGFEAELVHEPNANWLAVILLNRDDGRRLDALRAIRAVMNANPPPAVALR